MADSTPKRGLNLKTTSALGETYKTIDYLTGIMNKIHDFFNNKMFCDITLISKDGVYKIDAHKMILCASSEYFLAMFGGSMKEASETQVKLEIDGPSLECVINFIYSGSIHLTPKTVEDILITSSLLQLVALKTLCCEFIVKQLDPSNCLGITLFAEQYNLEELYKTSEIFVCNNFAKLCKDEEFFKLDVYQLSKFLSSSEVKVDSEEDIFVSLKSWINHDKPKREEFMSKLLHHVRFPLLTPKFIASAIEPSCKSIECERQILKAYKWHLLPDFRLSLYTEKQTQLRNFNGLLMAISGLSAIDSTLNVGYYYSTLDDWIYKTGISSLKIGRENFGYTTSKGKLIIAGGVLSTTKKLTDRVDCLDLRTFEWTSLAALNTKRKLFGMASLNGCIYAVGGSDNSGNLSSVEKYDPSTKQWKYVAAMNNSYGTLCVSATLNKLCVSTQEQRCSANFPLTNRKHSHNLYDPETDTWTDNWIITTDRLIGTGTVSVFSNHFFIAVSKTTITRYNFVIKSTETIPIPKNSLKYECTNCEAFGDRMIAYGPNCLQAYNPFSNEWTMIPQFQNNESKIIFISNR